MQSIALNRGGWCLSPEYFDAHTKLWWQCGDGHVWEANPNNIKNNKWCPYCVGRYKTIEDMNYIAESRGGKSVYQKSVLQGKPIYYGGVRKDILGKLFHAMLLKVIGVRFVQEMQNQH